MQTLSNKSTHDLAGYSSQRVLTDLHAWQTNYGC